MNFAKRCSLSLLLVAAPYLTNAQTGGAVPSASGSATADLAKLLGVSFPSGSQSTIVLTRNGKQYAIDAAARTIVELQSQTSGSARALTGEVRQRTAAVFAKNCSSCHGSDGAGNPSVGTPNFTDRAFQKSVSDEGLKSAIQNGKGGIMPAWSGRLSEEQVTDLVTYVRSLAAQSGGGSSEPPAVAGSASGTPLKEQPKSKIYQPGDDLLVSLPTGRPTDRHGVYVNFTHRFPYQAAFTGRAEGSQLFGLDNVAIPSFGFRYGLTDNLSIGVFRAPSLINRPIQLMAGYNIFEERKGNPLNLMVRLSIEGQDNFRKSYTENIEAILSRSIKSRAQVYLVPTVSFNDRRLEQPSGFLSNQIADVPGVNAFSLGAGFAFDIRPSVALLAEVIPTLANADELGIHRPAFSFGIQKKIWRHAFTLALTNSPGTTVSQRAATRATFLNDPSADTFGGLVLGFNITRQIK